MKTIRVGFVGNPNCGKTTLFNAYTGANLKVANWPGVTVEKKEGITQYKGIQIQMVDLPGIYSLTSYSIEEKVTRRCILENEVDVIVNIVDASSLERNLYLTLQVLELGKPVILALNMMDIVEERGMEIDLHRLPEMLGNIPVVPVSARRRCGLDVLLHAVIHHYNEDAKDQIVTYTPQIEEKIKQLQACLVVKYKDMDHTRWHAMKLLEFDEEVSQTYPVENATILDANYEKKMIFEKYEYIEEILEECLFYKLEKEAFTDKVDEILTNRFFGMPIFFLIMGIVFFLTFALGDALKVFFEMALDGFSSIVNQGLLIMNTSDVVISLVVDGIIAGVGGILTFLPNIFILFLALAILEDSGYMARVAYVMDGLMGKLGLSGKAFLPMVLGFGCTVPAVMATRALEQEADRKRTIVITPFMSCAARLPIYVLFADLFFPNYAMLASFSLYVMGLVLAIVVALILNKLDGKKEQQALLIELPEYKTPNARTIAIYVWEKVKDYLTKAGTIIFLASIVIWVLLNFNFKGMTNDMSLSFGAMLGKWLEPILAPAGLGMWQIAVALISGISAKEVVVSSFMVLFGAGGVGGAGGMTQLAEGLSAVGFGSLNAYCLMVFCLLYTPCAATIGTIKKETNSLKFTIGMVLFQLIVAWGMAVLIFQIGNLITVS